MSDLGRDTGGTPDEDRLPWLEPVEEERPDEGVSAGRLIAGLIVALLVLGLVVGGVYWLRQRAAGSTSGTGKPTEIAAAPGPYKIKPAEAGGMKVSGQGDASYAASEGADPNAPIDLSATPEAPVTRGKAAATPAAAPAKPTQVATTAPPAKPIAVPAKPAPAKPAETKSPAKTETAAAAPTGGQIQLGALASEAQADAVWKRLSSRFAYLAPLTKSVVKADVNGKTYYRLRAAAGSQASAICGKLKVAGESCIVVG